MVSAQSQDLTAKGQPNKEAQSMPTHEEQLVMAGDETSTVLESAAFNSVIN